MILSLNIKSLTIFRMEKKRTLTLHVRDVRNRAGRKIRPLDIIVDIDLCELKELVRKAMMEDADKELGLLEFARQHNRQFAQRVGYDRSKSSLRKYRTTVKHITAFLDEHYGVTDWEMGRIDAGFIRDFTGWLKYARGLSDGTIRLYLVALKHFVNMARRQGFISNDPFVEVSLPAPSRERHALTMEELRVLADIPLEGYARTVRDFFLFSCYTGLAYTDLCHLQPEHVERSGSEGWLTKAREKNGREAVVRLIPKALQLLDGLPKEPDSSMGWLSVPANRTFNKHLKALSLKLNLHCQPHFHTARHTFATLLLTAGVPIETVSLMLGHTRITTTQIYAQVTRNKITRDTIDMEQAFGFNVKTPMR